MSRVSRVYSREFKTAAVARVLGGQPVPRVAEALDVRAKLLYDWVQVLRRGHRGPRRPGEAQAARAPGLGVAAASCPAGQDAAAGELTAALARIAELERKIGRQQMELDFFRAALRQAGEPRQPKDGAGATACTPSSK